MKRRPRTKKEILSQPGQLVVPRTKFRRPSAQDYTGFGVHFKPGAVPTYEEFMADMKEQWSQQLRETERLGTGGYSAPIDFGQYMRESHAALVYQLEEVIPKKAADGLLSQEDAAAAAELGRIILGYVKRFLSS